MIQAYLLCMQLFMCIWASMYIAAWCQVFAGQDISCIERSELNDPKALCFERLVMSLSDMLAID